MNLKIRLSILHARCSNFPLLLFNVPPRLVIYRVHIKVTIKGDLGVLFIILFGWQQETLKPNFKFSDQVSTLLFRVFLVHPLVAPF